MLGLFPTFESLGKACIHYDDGIPIMMDEDGNEYLPDSFRKKERADGEVRYVLNIKKNPGCLAR